MGGRYYTGHFVTGMAIFVRNHQECVMQFSQYKHMYILLLPAPAMMLATSAVSAASLGGQGLGVASETRTA